MEVLDIAFAQLQRRTENTRLLKDSLADRAIQFKKAESLPDGQPTENVLTNLGSEEDPVLERAIWFAEWDETNDEANQVRKNRTLFEIGHNWNSEREIGENLPADVYDWQQFLNLSGWTNEDPGNPENYTQSGDGHWWYLTESNFINERARFNPFEDWAITFTVAVNQGDDSAAPDKVASVNDFLNAIANL